MNKHDLIEAGLTRRQTLLAMLGAAGLSACGGGGDVAGVGQGGTGAFSVGPITGLGSIIVNGIRYDDSAPGVSILSDDSTFRREDLRLGMVVAVQGSTVDANGQSTATRIVLGGELVGPIASKAVDGLSFVVLGQTVNIDGSTVFANRSGVSALNANDVVEVHGIADPANDSIDATYVEYKPSASEYRIQGVVDAVGAGDRFSINGLQMDYTDAGDVRVIPTVGALIRVRLDTAPVDSAYPVKRIRKPEDSFSGFSGEVEFKGTITAFTSASSFSVNDLPVNASGANFPDGTTGIKAGAFVEIKGSLVNGVVVATRVKLEDGGTAGGTGTEFELHGEISAAATADSGGSFTLTSSGNVRVTVIWTSGIEFRKGTATNLVNGRRVEVKGSLSGGTSVNAIRISFED